MSKHKFSGQFCDDIRREIGDKVSLMGCYTSDLIVPFFPVSLPKLCAYFTLSVPKDHLPQAPILIKIFMGDKEFQSLDIDITPFKNELSAQRAAPDGSERQFSILNGGVEMLGISFDKEVTLRSVAVVDGEILNGGVLHVVQPASAASLHPIQVDIQPVAGE